MQYRRPLGLWWQKSMGGKWQLFLLHPFGERTWDKWTSSLHQKNEERPFYCRGDSNARIHPWLWIYYTQRGVYPEFLYQDDGMDFRHYSFRVALHFRDELSAYHRRKSRDSLSWDGCSKMLWCRTKEYSCHHLFRGFGACGIGGNPCCCSRVSLQGNHWEFPLCPYKYVGVQSWQLDIGLHLFIGIVGGWIGSRLALQ